MGDNETDMLCPATETVGIPDGLDPWVLENKHLSG